MVVRFILPNQIFVQQMKHHNTNNNKVQNGGHAHAQNPSTTCRANKGGSYLITFTV